MIAVVLCIVALGGVFLFAVSQAFNPLWLLLILPAWIFYSMVSLRVKRTYNLKRYGYFGGSFKQGKCTYEEYFMGELRNLRINLENTEPGHWELFVPTESEWRAYAPDWATNRRREIIERVVPYLKSSDVHYPADYKK